jgi:hypothetical protein
MNCQIVQRRLLSNENPDDVPPDVGAHLAMCEECRQWQSQLVRIEHHVPLLPVPVSRAKGRVMLHFLKSNEQGGTDSTQATRAGIPFPPIPLPTLPEAAEWRLRSLPALSGLAAAMVLLALLGWWLLPNRGEDSTPPATPVRSASDTLLATVLRRDLRLARAGTVQERLEILLDLADDLHGETRTLAQAAAGEELKTLARLYEQVISDGIVKQAQALPLAERPRILDPIARRLSQMARQAERLVPETAAEHVKPVREIAASAHEGNRLLYALLRERTL